MINQIKISTKVEQSDISKQTMLHIFRATVCQLYECSFSAMVTSISMLADALPLSYYLII